jgi:hypothetical protein
MVALMCEHAGDFMRSRIDHAWDIIRGIHRRTQHSIHYRTATKSSQSIFKSLASIETDFNSLSLRDDAEVKQVRPELYVDAPARMIWNSLVALLCSIAGHISLRDDQALEICNADAFWLRLYRNGKHVARADVLNIPQGAGMNRLPVGRPHWQFVSVW